MSLVIFGALWLMGTIGGAPGASAVGVGVAQSFGAANPAMSTTLAASPTTATTTGDLLAATVRLRGPSGSTVAVASVTDSAGDTWVKAVAVTKGSAVDQETWYTANAASGTISGFAVGTDGTMSLLDPSGVTATVGPGNLDLALSVNSRYLYQLRGSGPITALRVESDGHLTTVGVVGNMPGSVAGLAAR